MSVTGLLQLVLKPTKAPDPILLSGIGFVYPATPMAKRGGIDFYSYKEPWSVSYFANNIPIGKIPFDAIYTLKGKSHRTRMAYYYYLFRALYKNNRIVDKNLAVLLCHDSVLKNEFSFISHANRVVLNFKLATGEYTHVISCFN